MELKDKMLSKGIFSGDVEISITQLIRNNKEITRVEAQITERDTKTGTKIINIHAFHKDLPENFTQKDVAEAIELLHFRLAQLVSKGVPENKVDFYLGDEKVSLKEFEQECTEEG